MNKKIYQKEYQKNYTKTNKRVSLVFDEKEYKKLLKLSEKYKNKPATFLKKIFTSFVKKEPILPPKLEEDIKGLTFLVSNIANNVNQMAFYSHTLRMMRDEQGLLLELQKLEKSVKEFILKNYKSNQD
jgi:hypothetical protein